MPGGAAIAADPRSNSATLDPASPARYGHHMPTETPAETVPRPSAGSRVVPASDPSRRRRRGRRPLLDGPKKETFLAAVRAGVRLPAAARYAGVSPKSANEWLRRGHGVDGRPAIEPYVSFAEEVERAQAEAEVHAVATVRQAMQRNWRAAAWWLERMHPEWRRPKDRGEGSLAVMPPAQPQGLILIDAATLRSLGSAQVRAQLGEPDVDEATQTRGERPVSG